MIMSALHEIHNLVGQIITKNGVYDACASTTKLGIAIRVTVKREKQRQRIVIRNWQIGFESEDFAETLKEVKRDLKKFIKEME